MTDAEVICMFMEPDWRLHKRFAEENPTGKTPGGWWFRGYIWSHRTLDLDALWEVEERLTDEQWADYEEATSEWWLGVRSPLFKLWTHATPEQKIAALASVLRPLVEAKS